MQSDKLAQILQRKPNEETTENKFFLILSSNANLQEHFLELQFRNGLHTCFAYHDITWFNYDPDGVIDLELNGFHAVIKGRGLMPLFKGIKSRTAVWVKEADSEMQDHKGNEAYVEEIQFGPTEMFADGEGTEGA